PSQTDTAFPGKDAERTMHYSWGRRQPAYHDKVFERATLPAWDARWQELSPAARTHFLNTLKVPAPNRASSPPGVPADRFPAAVLNELTEAGFVVKQPSGIRASREQVAIAERAVGFGNRMRGLRRYHLLTAYDFHEFVKYVQHCFAASGLFQVIRQVLRTAG